MVDFREIERLRTTATRLRRLAERVESALDGVVAYDRPDVWRGGRAQRFSAGLSVNRLRLRAARWELETEAARLDAEAQRLELVRLLSPVPS